jgi:Uncharacterized conserved protein
MAKSSYNNVIIDFIKINPKRSSLEILNGIGQPMSIATLKRALQQMIVEGLVISTGKLKGTKYEISPSFDFLRDINVAEYFEKEIDERIIHSNYDYSLIDRILNISTFNKLEIEKLNHLQERFKLNSSKLSTSEFKNEMERLAIDLSWKSSQIEGNTYSLLETERLLKDKETASGKTQKEAIMLLNHKSAIDFIADNPNYVHPLSISAIEDIHSILIKDLDIDRNIRKGRVGISGTNYRPLDNEFQIKESLEKMSKLINEKDNVFEKALLALALISYIQPFTDGNKRTARIISNAILLNNHYCPISFRTIDSIDYKKAMLIFYEQPNISAIKKIFIDQFEFAVNTYF